MLSHCPTEPSGLPAAQPVDDCLSKTLAGLYSGSVSVHEPYEEASTLAAPTY